MHSPWNSSMFPSIKIPSGSPDRSSDNSYLTSSSKFNKKCPLGMSLAILLPVAAWLRNFALFEGGELGERHEIDTIIRRAISECVLQEHEPYQVALSTSPYAVRGISPKTRIVPPNMSRAAISKGSPDQRTFEDDD